MLFVFFFFLVPFCYAPFYICCVFFLSLFCSQRQLSCSGGSILTELQLFESLSLSSLITSLFRVLSEYNSRSFVRCKVLVLVVSSGPAALPPAVPRVLPSCGRGDSTNFSADRIHNIDKTVINGFSGMVAPLDSGNRLFPTRGIFGIGVPWDSYGTGSGLRRDSLSVTHTGTGTWL